MLEKGDCKDLGTFINKNFDIRKSVMHISEENLKMISLAREVGASAKFTGSGGAIIGTYEDEETFARLSKIMEKENIKVIKPNIISTNN